MTNRTRSMLPKLDLSVFFGLTADSIVRGTEGWPNALNSLVELAEADGQDPAQLLAATGVRDLSGAKIDIGYARRLCEKLG